MLQKDLLGPLERTRSFRVPRKNIEKADAARVARTYVVESKRRFV